MTARTPVPLPCNASSIPSWRACAKARVIFAERHESGLLGLRTHNGKVVKLAGYIKPRNADVALHFLRVGRVRKLTGCAKRPVYLRIYHRVKIQVVAAPLDATTARRANLLHRRHQRRDDRNQFLTDVCIEILQITRQFGFGNVRRILCDCPILSQPYTDCAFELVVLRLPYDYITPNTYPRTLPAPRY